VLHGTRTRHDSALVAALVQVVATAWLIVPPGTRILPLGSSTAACSARGVRIALAFVHAFVRGWEISTAFVLLARERDADVGLAHLVDGPPSAPASRRTSPRARWGTAPLERAARIFSLLPPTCRVASAVRRTGRPARDLRPRASGAKVARRCEVKVAGDFIRIGLTRPARAASTLASAFAGQLDEGVRGALRAPGRPAAERLRPPGREAPDKQIAAALRCSERTVEFHVAKIFRAAPRGRSSS
jgi:hypothetical protein